MYPIILAPLLLALSAKLVSAQSGAWGQCGGKGWYVQLSGYSSCKFSEGRDRSLGLVRQLAFQDMCVLPPMNVRSWPSNALEVPLANTTKGYSQCIPGTAPPVTTQPVTTQPPVSTLPPSSTVVQPPSSTVVGPAPTGSQIRGVTSPVYHFYLQNNGKSDRPHLSM